MLIPTYQLIMKKIKIGGHLYKIEMVSGTALEEADCGKMNRLNNTISINAHMAKSQRDVTLIHEVLHALNNELSESLVDSLAEQIYAILVDNKFIK